MTVNAMPAVTKIFCFLMSTACVASIHRVPQRHLHYLLLIKHNCLITGRQTATSAIFLPSSRTHLALGAHRASPPQLETPRKASPSSLLHVARAASARCGNATAVMGAPGVGKQNASPFKNVSEALRF